VNPPCLFHLFFSPASYLFSLPYFFLQNIIDEGHRPLIDDHDVPSLPSYAIYMRKPARKLPRNVSLELSNANLCLAGRRGFNGRA
jgi:hypothetical protein